MGLRLRPRRHASRLRGAVTSYPRRPRRASTDADSVTVEASGGPSPSYEVPHYVTSPLTPIERLYAERRAVERNQAVIESVPSAERNWTAHAAGLRVLAVLNSEIARRGG
jgi:hypothetical protein